MKTKRWYRSWVIWLNFVTVLAAGAAELAPGLKGALSDKTYAWLAFGLGLLNMALRFKSDSKVTVRKAPQ